MVMSRRRIVYNGTEIISDTTIDETWDNLRTIRDMELERTDIWVTTSDRWADDEMATLLQYRQTLRDLPATYPNPNDAADNWPSRPEFLR